MAWIKCKTQEEKLNQVRNDSGENWEKLCKLRLAMHSWGCRFWLLQGWSRHLWFQKAFPNQNRRLRLGSSAFLQLALAVGCQYIYCKRWEQILDRLVASPQFPPNPTKQLRRFGWTWWTERCVAERFRDYVGRSNTERCFPHALSHCRYRGSFGRLWGCRTLFGSTWR